MVGTLTFVSIIVLGLIVACLGFYGKKYSFDENKKYLNLRAWGLLILALGFIIHTLGDYLSPTYGHSVELGLESSAHFIIMLSFVFFIISAKDMLKNTKEYWFK